MNPNVIADAVARVYGHAENSTSVTGDDINAITPV